MGICQNLDRKAKGILPLLTHGWAQVLSQWAHRVQNDSGSGYVLQVTSPVAREGCEGLIYEGSKTNGSTILEVKLP